MFEALASVLNVIVQPCYELTGNWWLAILLFTVIIKIILLPMSLWCQWNSIIMVQLMPALNRIKVKHYGDQETIGEAQNALYKEKHYHPLLSLVPLIVQILILFGLVEVIHGITDYGAPGTELLGMIPIEDGGISWMWPALAGLSAVIMGFAQNRINPLQKEQSRMEKNMTNGLSIALSLFLGVFVAAGMAFYWVCSNLMAVAIQAICNIIIKPKKYIDYEDLAESRVALEELESIGADRKRKWYQRDPLAKREKADYKRFFNTVNKHVVFYSEGSGFYKYFQGVIDYLLSHSNVFVHYVTNDPNDQIFKIAEQKPRIRPYYIGEKKAITLMMKMDADIVVATLEDLDTYYIKRSYIRKDTKYIFLPHHMTSIIMVCPLGALSHYDAIMCTGPHQKNELAIEEDFEGFPKKELVEYGSPLLEKDIARYEALDVKKNERPTILIGPSWQEDNILDLCIDDILKSLLGHGWRIIVRPHPEYTKRYKARWQSLQSRYADVPAEELYFEQDFSSDETIYTSDILMTDWSSICCEFSFSTLKPTIFIDTPMKIGNKDWEKYGTMPVDISLRSQIGRNFDPSDCTGLAETVEDMIVNSETWSADIARIRDGFIYNLGSSAEIGGKYILEQIIAKQEERKKGGSA